MLLIGVENQALAIHWQLYNFNTILAACQHHSDINIILAWFWHRSSISLSSVWHHFDNILVVSPKHSGTIPASFWHHCQHHSSIMSTSFWQHFSITLASVWHHVDLMLVPFPTVFFHYFNIILAWC